MKTRIDSRLKNKKGLTFAETLIVVAIIVILFGLSVIGVKGLIDRINQTKLDNVAQSMYVSAQNRIMELKASGEIDKLLTVTDSVANKPADWTDDPGDTVNYNDLKYFYHNKDSASGSTSSDLIDFLFPKGSVDDGVLDDNWIIEFDPVTGYVYSAFYSEKRSANDYYINNTSSLDQSGNNSIRFKEFRHGLKGNEKVGYYGGKANMPADLGGGLINASLNIINADILKARMTVITPLAMGLNISDFEFKLTVKGKTSNNTVTLKPIITSNDVGTTRVFSAIVILDSLEANLNFKDTFGSATWQPTNYVESRTGALTPGEDLELSFTVSSSNDSIPDAGPIKRTANSLFASLDVTNPTEMAAGIAYGRHLQNLDKDTSDLPTTVTSAKQISDINFNDESDKDLPAQEQFLWKTLYGEKTFKPINNPDLKTYSGYIASPPNPNSFKIFNMHIGNIAGPAGMFASFSGNEISGITMVNQKIDGGTNIGGFAGTTASNLTIKDCRLYVEKKFFKTGTNVDYEDNILFNATPNVASNVGGLVGSSTAGNIIIKDSFAATIMQGRTLGGLIGSKTNGKAQIQDSYSDSYLIGDASTSKIGGLAGSLTNTSTISGSYSAGFGIIKSGLTGKIDSAAGFVPSNISSINNSYSVFNYSESEATNLYSTARSATLNKVYYFGSGDNNLTGSSEYKFESISAAATNLGSKFSSDDNKNDTYPYNQKTGLGLKTYPYASLTGLPHYGDWQAPEEKDDFGKAGLFYWEKVTGGSDPGYQIYMVGRRGESGSYEAVFNDTINTAHNDGGIVKEYGYGYYVDEGTTLEVISWSGVHLPDEDKQNTAANASFENNPDYNGYKFHCYTTCDENNLATNYQANVGGKYLFMAKGNNDQNATVTLKPEGEDNLNYTFCPFFAKSIKLTGWAGFDDGTGAKPTHPQYEPGTAGNKYRIRSLDQLQFINWNSVGDCGQRVIRATHANFPYLHKTKKENSIKFGGDGPLEWGWYYSSSAEVWGDFDQSRKAQNFIQDYDIECIGRTGYYPIAALGDRTGWQADSFRLPLFAWFGGSFDGQSYKIKNLSIISRWHSVGVFGVTVGATLKNIVLIGDSGTGPVIIRPANSEDGFYAIGTLVGIANEYYNGKHSPLIIPNKSINNYNDDYKGVIENCAVAGYKIIDESEGYVTCGETSIGGLVGILRTKINKCSAVNEINIKTKNIREVKPSYAGIDYGDYISVGGIAGKNQTYIYNCYSGGKVEVAPSLVTPKIYISGIAPSAMAPRFVNMHDNDARIFRNPEYNNCYSYMDLPDKADNIMVGTIAANSNYMAANPIYAGTFYTGGVISNSYHYQAYKKPNQELCPVEMVGLLGNLWSGQSIERPYYNMSQQQFCDELNNVAYHKVTPDNYSFPCGDASLEGTDFPFAAVITQEHKNDPSDSEGTKYVHYGEWPTVIYNGNLILNHHNGTETYIPNSYVYSNGDDGIPLSLISTDSDKLYYDLRNDMTTKGTDQNTTATFEGWYLKDAGGNLAEKVLNADGTVYTGGGDIPGITEGGQLAAPPGTDIELYAVWKITYNILTLCETGELGINRKYIAIAREPREGESGVEYYCMTGTVGYSTSLVTVKKVNLEKNSYNEYFIPQSIDQSTMVWQTEQRYAPKKTYFKLLGTGTHAYLKKDTDGKATITTYYSAADKPEYEKATHKLIFKSDRVVLNSDKNGFVFEQKNSSPNDGGIWLFEYNATSERTEMYEFK